MNHFQKFFYVCSLIWIPSLGYFVDVFDLVLFNVVRVDSLQELGLNKDMVFNVSIYLGNCQRLGLIVGAFLWGVLADRHGRVKALSGSVLLYSLATGLNAYVTNISQYAGLRFLAGMGLAGEMGIAIAWTAEVLPVSLRSMGITLIALCGLLGGVFASSVIKWFHWKYLYIMGGAMGLLLLTARHTMQESLIFMQQPTRALKGKIGFLLLHPLRFKRYCACIALSMPIALVSGVFMVFAWEIAALLHIQTSIKPHDALFFSFLGTCFGDVLCGYCSHIYANRKKVLVLFLVPLFIMMTFFLLATRVSAPLFFTICFLVGFFSGYWVLALALCAEQFGTNTRAMVTTTVPNFMRVAPIPLLLLLKYLSQSFGMLFSCGVLMVLCFLIAAWGFSHLEESFHKSLDFIEI